MEPLRPYRAKRDFQQTPEPAGEAPAASESPALRFVIQEHYHEARPHQGLGQRRPCEPADEVRVRTGPVERRDGLGGLLHEYRRAA